jgi:site-specific recombinase XerC
LLKKLIENIRNEESVKRWVQKLTVNSKSMDFSQSQTQRAAIFWLKNYCNYLNLKPDIIIKQRTADLESTVQIIKRKHEEMLEGYILHLKNKGYAPNTVAVATGLVRSWYKSNYSAIVEVKTPRSYNIRAFKVPTVKDLKAMAEKANPAIKAWILCQANCGLANTDLLSLSGSTTSSEYGTIKTQLKKGVVPIHIEVRRQKTGEKTDTFLGQNAIDALHKYLAEGENGKLFHMSMRSIQQKVKALGINAKVATNEVPVTSYCLRKFFNTQMKYAGVNESIVELMMGHSIGKVRSAYLVTGSGDVGTGIPISKLAEIYMQAYPTIDITKV